MRENEEYREAWETDGTEDMTETKEQKWKEELNRR